MYIKIRTLVILLVVVILAMVVEWNWAQAVVIREYHGLCNYGVGWPYKDFIHELRTLSDSGKTNSLARILQNADERSMDIFDVWLDNDPKRYIASLNAVTSDGPNQASKPQPVPH